MLNVVFFSPIRVDGASNHSGEQFQKDVVPLSGFTHLAVLIVRTEKSKKKILYAVSKIPQCEWTGPESNITRRAVLRKIDLHWLKRSITAGLLP